jgi:general nucleoside transport system permease protein
MTRRAERGSVHQRVTLPWHWRPPEALTRAVFVIGIVVLGVPIILRMLGFEVAPAVEALFRGSLGSGYAITSGTLVRATPLMLTGLSVAIAFRAGVFNIGAEGQLLAGASAATAVASLPVLAQSYSSAWIGLVAGAIAGAAWAGIAALLRARFHVLEVISTILLNFVALYMVGFLVRGPLQEPLHIYPQSATLGLAARLPRILPSSRLHAGFLIAVGAALVAWWLFRYSAAGFRLRVVGANPDAARIAGEIDVARTTTRAFIVSGALAGLAGAIEVTGVTFALYENLSPGYGYTGIAVALLARLDPLGVIASGLLFGALEAGASAMQRDASVPSVVVSMIEAIILLGLIVAWPLDRSERAHGRRRSAVPETGEA